MFSTDSLSEPKQALSPILWIPARTDLYLNATILKQRSESPAISRWNASLGKRCFDIFVSAVAITILALPMLIIALLIRLSSPGPALFVQKRVGRGRELFSMYKFRSMRVPSGSDSGPTLTRDGDHRITRIGKILRKLKLDELPQFFNVLRGDMSLIGPRPKLPKYAAINMPFRPGISGAATLAFRREEEVLRHVHPAQLDAFYNRHIRPLKASIDLHYMAHATFWSDIQLIFATFWACIVPDAVPVVDLPVEAPERLSA
jgi:lipopolysaccharide/colanic/teichoic acid biosynthesis glycosyltransferase